MVERDYIDLGTITPIKAFSRQLAEISSKFVREHKPFDGPCARLDFADKLEQAGKEAERRQGYMKFEELKIDKKDLEKYGDPDRFEIEAIDDDTEMQKITTGGTIERINVVVGKTVRYRCKQRGHGISVSMNMDEYEKLFPKKEVKKKEL